MSSYLEKSQETFRNAAASAASKVSNKRTLAPPPSAPSPSPSNASAKSDSKDQKRKREEKHVVVYSQPAKSGYGDDLLTQITYIIDFLKKKGEGKTLAEILEYLSKVNEREDRKKTMAAILRKHGSVEWIPESGVKTQHWDSGTFRHRPKLPVRNKQDLIAYLQRKPDARGVSVADLKDGWPDCEASINQLEYENMILVTRTKKDNHARWVWLDDVSLVNKVDHEFIDMWRKIELPSPDDTVRNLLAANQIPAGEDPSKRIKVAPGPKAKRKKATRKAGRTTNTHMEHLLRDYSYMKQ